MFDYPPTVWSHKRLFREYENRGKEIIMLKKQIEHLSKVIIKLRQDPRVPDAQS